MTGVDEEVREISDLEDRIGKKLDELGYPQDDSWGNIVHHLAEVTYMGKRLALDYMPRFLSLAPADKEQLAELSVDIDSDLNEMKEAITDMQSDLIKLVNFLNP